MRRNLLCMVLMTFSIVTLGCGGKRVKTVPDDPVQKHKDEFLLRYGFFVTREEKVSYYKDSLGVVGKENEIFKGLKTIEDVDKFIEVFWKQRDPNPNTPENELKDSIDKRIQDIEDEIFASDPDIPGTLFARNGGLKGELAHVYLFYGRPSYSARLSEGRSHVELMVWYYFDVRDKPLFRFLFYKNYGSTHLFTKHISVISQEYLFDPVMSPLKEISNRIASTPQELYEIWQELELEDINWAFRAALIEFSYYYDINIWDALKAPRPAALTAVRFKPTILGQPDDLTGREFINSSYNSFIPAKLRITKDNHPSFTLSIGYADVDWEINGQNAEFVSDLRISFQNKTTKKIKEFSVRFKAAKTREEVEVKKRNAVIMEIPLDNIQNFAQLEQPRQTLHQLIDQLEPGTYIVNVDLQHAVTKKRAGGWREEIVIN